MTASRIDQRDIEPPAFTEVQRFTQIWMWVVIFFSDLFALGIGRLAAYDPKTSPTDRIVVICLVSFVAALPIVLMLVMKMQVDVRSDSIALKFSPFHITPRIFELSTIASAEAVTYRPMIDYGGWGLRKNRQGDYIYNVRGDRGVLLTFKDGKKLTIGSQRPDDLAREISQRLGHR